MDKTVIQHLIDIRNKNFDAIKFVKYFDENKQSLLKIEEEQIIDAWIDDAEQKEQWLNDAKNYYNLKYKRNG